MKEDLKKDNLILRTYTSPYFKECVESTWLMETLDKPHDILIPADQFVYLVFPLSGCGFYVNGHFSDKPIIYGITLKNVLISFPPRTRIFGVRLYACGLYPFIPLKGKELFNQYIPFPSDNNQVAVGKIQNAVSDKECTDAAFRLLSSMYNKKRDERIHLVKKFYFNMVNMDNVANIQEFCSRYNTNYTTLNRVFNDIIGLSAKKLERLIKFRKAVNMLIASPDKLVDIGANSGYFDQPHFIKEFKYYMDMSPSDYLRLLRESNGHSNYGGIGLAII